MHEVNLSRADLNLLVVFDAIAETRSVTTAAEQLSLSQPAVSHALRRLRDLMSDPLFVRGRNGLVLTPRAAECVEEVRAILAAVSRVVAVGPFDPRSTKRTFRLAASDYALMTSMPGIVSRLRAAAPFANLDVAHVGGDVPARLERGEVDVAFVGAADPDAAIISRELFREHIVGLVCARHPIAGKARKGILTLKEYLAYPHVAVTFRNARQSPIDARLEELGKSRRVAMVTPSFSANIASLHGTDLIMSLPSRLAAMASEKTLITFRLPLSVPDYPYLMSWHRRTDADAALAWLRGQIIEATRELRQARPATSRG